MGRPRDPNAQNRQHRAGPYVATTMRWEPADVEILEDLIAHYADKTGRPFNRTSLLKYLIAREHRLCCPRRYGQDGTLLEPSKRPVTKESLPTHRRKSTRATDTDQTGETEES